jgi:hypothetical protein
MDALIDRPNKLNGCSLIEAFEAFCSEFNSDQLFQEAAAPLDHALYELWRIVEETGSKIAVTPSWRVVEETGGKITATLLGHALVEVRRRIEATGCFSVHPALARLIDGSPQAKAAYAVSGLEWEIHNQIWTPFLEWFRNGRLIAKGRLNHFDADKKNLPQGLFRTAVKFDFVRPEIDFEGGIRAFDVEAFSAEHSPAEDVRTGGGDERTAEIPKRDTLSDCYDLIIDDLLMEVSSSSFPKDEAELFGVVRRAAQLPSATDDEVRKFLLDACKRNFQHWQLRWNAAGGRPAHNAATGQDDIVAGGEIIWRQFFIERKPRRSTLKAKIAAAGMEKRSAAPNGEWDWREIVERLMLKMNAHGELPATRPRLEDMIREIVQHPKWPARSSIDNHFKRYKKFDGATKELAPSWTRRAGGGRRG